MNFEFVIPCRSTPVRMSIRADCLVVGYALAQRGQMAVAGLIDSDEPEALPVLLIAPLPRDRPRHAA